MTNVSSSAAMKGDETACAGSSPFSVVALDIGGTKVAGCVAVYEHAGACPKVMLKKSIPSWLSMRRWLMCLPCRALV